LAEDAHKLALSAGPDTEAKCLKQPDQHALFGVVACRPDSRLLLLLSFDRVR